MLITKEFGIDFRCNKVHIKPTCRWSLKLCLILTFLGTCLFSDAQKIISHDQHTWLGMFNQTRISKRWGTWTDVNFRLKNDFVKDPFQFLLRFGPTFYITDDFRFTAAYSFINHYPDETHPNISQPEHRPFQQIQWYNRYSKSRIMQYIRLEERFRRKLSAGELAEGYDFNWRIRYNYVWSIALSKKGFSPGTFQLVLNDEIMFNFGKKIVYNYFDQNRLFVGLSYVVNKDAQFQFGYMNLFQQLPAGNRYRTIDAIRLIYFHNFDLRKK
jgi:hypothetical protein